MLDANLIILSLIIGVTIFKTIKCICDSMKEILLWPEGTIILPNCPPGSGAHPKS